MEEEIVDEHQNELSVRLGEFCDGKSSFLWIGAQFPQEKFLSYGRILTLDYYFLLMCILLSLIIIHHPLVHSHFSLSFVCLTSNS